MLYVAIPRLNGRHDWAKLVVQLGIRGFEDRVEYAEGGWVDTNMSTVLPHLRFSEESDALAYTLAFGGTLCNTTPVR